MGPTQLRLQVTRSQVISSDEHGALVRHGGPYNRYWRTMRQAEPAVVHNHNVCITDPNYQSGRTSLCCTLLSAGCEACALVLLLPPLPC